MKKNEIVYQKLKDMILNHALDESAALNERELADLFGSSRTPVREAINKLSNQGLLYVVPGRGTFIKNISVEDVIEIYNIKEALDCLAISLSMEKITRAEIDELQRIIRAMERSASEEDADKFFKMDIEFHNVYIKSTGSERLEEMLERLDEQIIAYVIASVKSKSRMEMSLKEHRALLQAIIKKDVTQAQNAIRDHMQSVKQFHISRLRS